MGYCILYSKSIHSGLKELGISFTSFKSIARNPPKTRSVFHPFIAPLDTKRNETSTGSDRFASQPGEIIFYESASVLHGRPEPFQGDSFTNIFVHFAPVEGWDVSANDVNRAAREGARKKARESRTAPLKNE